MDKITAATKPKNRAEILANPMVRSLQKKNGYRVVFNDNVYVRPVSQYKGKLPIVDSGTSEARMMYSGSLEEISDFLRNGATSDYNEVEEALKKLAEEQEAQEIAKRTARERAFRGDTRADVPDELANSMPLLRSNILVEAMSLTFANPLPVLVSQPTYKKLAGMEPDMTTWQAKSLLAVADQMNKLARMRAEIIAMDVDGYQKALEGLKASASRYIEEGPDTQVFKASTDED